jgi:hypothetical protein
MDKTFKARPPATAPPRARPTSSTSTRGVEPPSLDRGAAPKPACTQRVGHIPPHPHPHPSPPRPQIKIQYAATYDLGALERHIRSGGTDGIEAEEEAAGGLRAALQARAP